MSELFERAYRKAFDRGHVVCVAALHVLQTGLGRRGTREDPTPFLRTLRLAETLVDEAEEFWDSVRPMFAPAVFDTQQTRAVHIPKCQQCGSEVCASYAVSAIPPGECQHIIVIS